VKIAKFDGVLKDLFQRDRPTLLDRLSGGIPVVEVRTEEFQDVQQRHTDLIAPLVDGSVLHIEIQGQNHRDMPYREGMYCLMIGHKYNCKVRQVVLYVGQAKMKMQVVGQFACGAGWYPARRLAIGASLRGLPTRAQVANLPHIPN
jgi:hypothetical protein